MLYDFVCHHFEYLEEQNHRAIRQERKQSREERLTTKDVEKEKCAERTSTDDEASARSTSSVKHIAYFLADFPTPQEHVLTSADLRKMRAGSSSVERCAFHLGSLTREDEEPLYAVFEANPGWPFRSHQRWMFHAWSDEYSLIEQHGLCHSTSSSSTSSSKTTLAPPPGLALPSPDPISAQLLLPSPPLYFRGVEDLYLVPGVKIYLNAEHLLRTKANRKLLDQCTPDLSFDADTARRALLDLALSRCLRALQSDPSLAVPQSRADPSGAFRLEFLAPLYLVKLRKSRKPDLVVALEKRFDGQGRLSCYIASSLLTVDQAYANARRVKKIHQTWLTAAHGVSGTIAKRGHKVKRIHDHNDHEDEFNKIDKDIEKWASETEGEESDDTEEDSSDSGFST